MHVYFAGATRVEEGFPELQHEIRKRLVSYHYQTASLDKYYYEDERDKYESIILDSGAFSAWSQEAIIDIEKYAQYILKWQDKVDYVVNLDVIPAKPGVKPTADEIERSASKGYENYRYLLSMGVQREKLIHVFHQHENEKWLRKMVYEDKIPYIGLSPANDMNTLQKMKFLDSCMPIVTDAEGKATVKFHGFAVTSYELMERYPWFSVDSSTWAVAGGRGEIFTPQLTNDKMDFTKAPEKVSISQIARSREHYLNLFDKDPSSTIVKNLLAYFELLNIPLGCQFFLRVPKDYVIKKHNGFKKCSNSFIRHMEFELPVTDGFLTPEQLDKIDLNKKHTVRLYEGPDHIWVEHIIGKGVINYWKERQRVNAIFMNTFVGILDAQEPRAYNLKLQPEGFGLYSKKKE